MIKNGVVLSQLYGCKGNASLLQDHAVAKGTRLLFQFAI